MKVMRLKSERYIDLENVFSKQRYDWWYKSMTYYVLRDRFGLRKCELAHTLKLEHMEIREVVGER